jgi:hypothetical protein
MFNIFAHSAIDAIQEAKHKFVKATVIHQGVKEELENYIIKQTKYTKEFVDTLNNTSLKVTGILVDPKTYNKNIWTK